MKQAIIASLCLISLAGCRTSGTVTPEPFAITPPPPVVAAGPSISGGGLVGGTFGESLSAKDRQAALNAEYKALEYGKVGEVSDWTGEGALASGKVKAAQAYRVGSQDCRQYSHEIVVNGATRGTRGAACRNNDGSWSLLE